MNAVFYILYPIGAKISEKVVPSRHDYYWRDANKWCTDDVNVVGNAHVMCTPPLYS